MAVLAQLDGFDLELFLLKVDLAQLVVQFLNLIVFRSQDYNF